MPWKCSCGLINASINSYCPGKLTWKEIEHIQITPSTYDETLYWAAEGRVNKLLMTPNEELHAKFFREEAIFVLNMSDDDLDEHIHELETIAREAKARITAATEEKRNRAAKSGNKKWRVEPLGPDPTVTDSLNKVKQRSARMTKVDRMRDRMAALGIPDSELDQMLARMVALARKEPKALEVESQMKKDLASSPIITEEEKIRRAAERKALDERDKAEEKAEQEKAKAEKEAEAQKAEQAKAEQAKQVVNPFELPAKSKAHEPVQGKLDISTLKFK
jgi:hypothetical protein